jgi:hypothetical protein
MSTVALDFTVIGISCGARPFRVAAAATRYYHGEPANSLSARTAGAADVNTIVVMTDTKPRVATDNFVGIFAQNAPGSGALAAHTTLVDVPIPNATLIRGKAKTATNIDTDAELLAILWDAIDIDLTAAVYTFDETAASNASGFIIQNGDTSKQTLDCWVDARAMRKEVA